MDLKQAVILALQVSVLITVFGFGLKTTVTDFLYVIRRPGLLARSLLAVFIIMPVIILLLVRTFGFPPAVEVVLVALAISPVPPLLPRKGTKAGGDASYALGLMAILALLSIVTVPLSLELIERISVRSLDISPGAIARMIATAILIPLAAGMAVRAMLPAIAPRIEKVTTLVAAVLLPAALLALLFGTASAIWAHVGTGTIIAIAVFTVAGLVVGHVLGAPDPEQSAVLAFSTACRHPAVALTIAATNYPDQQFAALIIFYLIVNAIVCIPYLMWRRRQVKPQMSGATAPLP